MKKLRITEWILLFVYIIILIDFTLLDDAFGRNIFNIQNFSFDSFVNYIDNSLNLIPFSTVKLYINGVAQDKISLAYFVINIFGNLIMLIPLTYFIPRIFKGINCFFKLLIALILFSVAIEILQLIFLTGSCDIDDVILNVTGAAIAYPILKNTFKEKTEVA